MANQNPIGSATGTLSNGSLNTTYTLYDSTLLQGFSDPDGDTLKISGLWADSGELTDLGNGSWSLVPETDYSGNVVFDYVVFDSKGGEIQGVLNLNIIAPQTAPTGSVTISGTPQQNQTLWATNNLADANGLGAISYQWLINNSTVVSNTDSYALTQNDVGKSISLKASYTDGLGKLEIVSSSSVIVANMNDLPTGNVSISGTSTQGQTLTASNTLADLDGLGTIGYQWLNNGNVISGATQSTYTLTASDAGKAISVKASYTDLQNTTESKVSDTTALVTAPQTAPTGSVTLDGTAQQNQTLTVNTSALKDVNGLGNFSYQWLSGGTVISGQTSQSYALTQTDVGKAISVKVSYTDGLSKAESMTSSSVTITNVNDLPTGSVIISGDMFQNQTLSANNDIADLDGLGTISYQWLSSGTPISGATKNTYTLAATDIGKEISVKASYTDGFNKLETVTSSVTQAVLPPKNDAPTGNVTISGIVQQNQTLTASNTLADVNGMGVVSYQWLSGSVELAGKTQSTYALTQSDVGKEISVKASYTDGLKKLESVTSSSVTIFNINDTPTGTVTISGTPTQGQTLTATNTLADLDGLGIISYQWQRESVAISGANQASYFLTQSDVNKKISVAASYTDGFGKLESVSSANATIANVNDVPTGSLTIEGFTTQNQVLTAVSTLADADGLGVLSYQWFSNGVAISGATKSTYSLTQTDVGKTLKLTASYTDGFGKSEIATSNITSIIENSNDSPVGSVIISGDAITGKTLVLQNKITDIDGIKSEFSYQWQANGENLITGDRLTLTKNEIGKTIHVIASYTDNFGTAESVQSADTQAVTKFNNKPTGGVFIDGDQIVGSLLSVKNELKDADGLGEMSYQWLVNGEKSSTGKTFTLTDNEIGKTISVTASYTDNEGNNESVTSSTTGEIIKENNPVIGALVVKGDAKVGKTLSVANTLDDADGLGVFNYQWLANGNAIKNATQDTYKPTKTDTDKKISVQVSFIDGANNSESITSADTGAIKASNINGLTKKGDASANKIIGAAKNDDLSGLAGADTLIGNAGDDLLDGGAGNDSLNGGNGNDELTGGDGNDTLISGSGDDLLDAGKGDDKLVGDKGNDTLKGGLGADNMNGGDGNDYYFVDNQKDVVTETNSNVKTGGNDTIESTSSYTLGDNIEKLVLKDDAGKGNSGTGNNGDNVMTGSIGDNNLQGMAGNDKLIGNAGADILDGGKGMDTLIGGVDDDIYYMNNTEDKIIENENGGEDQIIADVNFELSTAPNVENLELAGTKARTAKGNELNNLLQEQAGGKIANVFDGQAGDDTINGEGGNDTIEGGEGNDVIDGGDGKDTVIFTGAKDNYDIKHNLDADSIDQIIVNYVGNLENDEIDEGTDILSNIEVLQFADNETINTRDISVDVVDSNRLLIIVGIETSMPN